MAKTTLELPDELMREVRIRSVNERRRLKDVIADLLRRGLSETLAGPPGRARRVRLPLIECAHPAGPGAEMTPERLAELLLREEADSLAQP